MAFLGGFLGGAAGSVVSIIITAKDDYSRQLQKAQAETHKMGKSVTQMSAVTKIALTAAATAFIAFTASAIKGGIEMKKIEAGFRSLARGSDDFLRTLKEVTNGTVSSFELMASANKALLLGIEQNKLPELFRAAVVVGRAAGRSATEAIEDISTGIGRQSKLILTISASSSTPKPRTRTTARR